MNIFDSLSSNPITLFKKNSFSIIRCGEVLFLYFNGILVEKLHIPFSINKNFCVSWINQKRKKILNKEKT